MKVKTKVVVILTADEENTLTKARDILQDICYEMADKCEHCPFVDVCGVLPPHKVVETGLFHIANDNEIYGEEES